MGGGWVDCSTGDVGNEANGGGDDGGRAGITQYNHSEAVQRMRESRLQIFKRPG